MDGPIDSLPASHQLHHSDNVEATRTPWIVVTAGAPPTHRWYTLPRSAAPHAIAWQHGMLHLSLLPCSDEPIADMCSDVSAACAAAYALSDQYPTYVPLLMRGCIAVRNRGRLPSRQTVPKVHSLIWDRLRYSRVELQFRYVVEHTIPFSLLILQTSQ